MPLYLVSYDLSTLQVIIISSHSTQHISTCIVKRIPTVILPTVTQNIGNTFMGDSVLCQHAMDVWFPRQITTSRMNQCVRRTEGVIVPRRRLLMYLI